MARRLSMAECLGNMWERRRRYEALAVGPGLVHGEGQTGWPKDAIRVKHKEVAYRCKT